VRIALSKTALAMTKMSCDLHSRSAAAPRRNISCGQCTGRPLLCGLVPIFAADTLGETRAGGSGTGQAMRCQGNRLPASLASAPALQAAGHRRATDELDEFPPSHVPP